MSLFNGKSAGVHCLNSESKSMNTFDMTDSLLLYDEFFISKMRDDSNHTIPSEFVIRCVNHNAIWIIALLIGVAGYAIEFSESTSNRLSIELLNKHNIYDPCFKRGLVSKPWVQKTSLGKRPTDPICKQDKSGLSIANFDAEGLIDFYTEKSLVIDNKVITLNDEPIKGWGLSYDDDKYLSLSSIFWNYDIASLYRSNTDDRVYLSNKRLNELIPKCVGSSTESRNFQVWDRNLWYEWSRYYLTGEGANKINNRVFPAAKWFCSYWWPYFKSYKNEKDIEKVMMLSAIANSTTVLANKLIGKQINEMIGSYGTNQHRRHRVYNMLRAIELVKFIQNK
jgi:hypothetical protein